MSQTGLHSGCIVEYWVGCQNSGRRCTEFGSVPASLQLMSEGRGGALLYTYVYWPGHSCGGPPLPLFHEGGRTRQRQVRVLRELGFDSLSGICYTIPGLCKHNMAGIENIVLSGGKRSPAQPPLHHVATRSFSKHSKIWL